MTENPPIFWVNNKHGAKMGKPPEIDGNAPNRYFAYFENEYREQAIFVYDYDTKTGTFWMGDAGWEKSYLVVNGKVEELQMSLNETIWLKLCWETAISMMPP
jgi:hypothetical protein